jgi:hypothetical protein
MATELASTTTTPGSNMPTAMAATSPGVLPVSSIASLVLERLRRREFQVAAMCVNLHMGSGT